MLQPCWTWPPYIRKEINILEQLTVLSINTCNIKYVLLNYYLVQQWFFFVNNKRWIIVNNENRF